MDPPRAVFDGMLSGWGAQQRSRMLNEATIAGREWLVQRFAEFTNEYPWALARPGRRGLHDVVADDRGGALDDPRLSPDPDVVCRVRVRSAVRLGRGMRAAVRAGPALICHEWNTAAHVSEFEGASRPPGDDRRGATAVLRLRRRRGRPGRGHGRKGTFAAFRDAALFKVAYAWGLRRRELVMLDVADLHRNAHRRRSGASAPACALGKASRGTPPKRRTVLSVHGLGGGCAAAVCRGGPRRV